MPRKWKQEHTNEVVKRFRLHCNGDEDEGWDPTRASEKSNRRLGRNYPAAEWFGKVKGSPGWEDISLQIFRYNVSSTAQKFLANNGLGDESGEGQEEITSAIEVTHGTAETEVAGNGEKIIIGYTQCAYSVRKAGGPASTKVFIIIHAVSGWYISLEQGKGDFFVLSEDGNTLRLSITSNERLFDPTFAERLLTSGVFGSAYDSPAPGLHHSAVTALATSIKKQMHQGKVPSRILEIPLLKSCARISPIEGLHKRNVPDLSAAPVALYYKQSQATNLTTIHIELDGKDYDTSTITSESLSGMVSSPTLTGNSRGGNTMRGRGSGNMGGGNTMGGRGSVLAQRGGGSTRQCVGSASSPQGRPRSGGDAFSMSDLQSVLSETVETRVQPIKDMLSKLAGDVQTMMKSQTQLNDRIADYDDNIDNLEDCITKAKKELTERTHELSTSNIFILGILSEYRDSIDLLSKEGSRRERLYESLRSSAVTIKNQLETQISDLKNDVEDIQYELDASDITRKLDDAAAEIKKMSEDYILSRPSIEELEMGLEAESFDKATKVSNECKMFLPIFKKLKQTVQEDLERSQKMYEFCKDLLIAGKVSFGNESSHCPPVTPPRDQSITNIVAV